MVVTREPAIDHATAMQLAATEYARILATLKALDPTDWRLPTSCELWNVRQMACHVVGMAAMIASPLELLRQSRLANKGSADGSPWIDALTGLQVSERESLTPEQILTALEKTGPKAAKGRRRIPGVARRMKTLPARQTDGLEPWKLGYLTDVILTRDPWMHRMDIAEATRRPPELTAAHDGVIVADAATEWAKRHGQPCRLVLTGPAGGSWTFGEGGPDLEFDAVEFCRLVGGRAEGEGLVKTQVPF
jgi:uncharacterized protein (TIGR03083 family)